MLVSTCFDKLILLSGIMALSWPQMLFDCEALDLSLPLGDTSLDVLAGDISGTVS